MIWILKKYKEIKERKSYKSYSTIKWKEVPHSCNVIHEDGSKEVIRWTSIERVIEKGEQDD